MKRKIQFILALLLPLLTSCSFNPFSNNNHTTGTPEGALIGGGVGAGTAALAGAPKFMYIPAIIGGSAIGYYFTTLRYDSGGVIQAGGNVYQIGDNVGIYIPSDQLFEPNSAELLPQAGPILDSAATILQRYPNNNLMISGNTSGFGRPRWERRLSEARAQKVAAYLWDQGINNFKGESNDTRKLNYVGYGDYFPIASDLTNNGIRENSRIQITSYPSSTDLKLDKRSQTIHNIGALKDDTSNAPPTSDGCGKLPDATGCFKD